MPQTEDEFRAAYRAGYEDRQHERDWDPMAHAPDDLLSNTDLEGTIPLYVPGFESGVHTEGILGRVVIAGDRAVIKLLDGNDFQKRLQHGAYVGMFVQFPVGFSMKDLGLENKQPEEVKGDFS